MAICKPGDTLVLTAFTSADKDILNVVVCHRSFDMQEALFKFAKETGKMWAGSSNNQLMTSGAPSDFINYLAENGYVYIKDNAREIWIGDVDELRICE